MSNPLQPFLDAQGFVVLDGGLGTSLEAEGVDINDPLWSAKVLLGDMAPLRRVHEQFLEAGADVIGTCTYQATVPGLVRAGLSEAEARRVMGDAVSLALEVRDGFTARRALVAASIGPYGAFLSDGSEYTGAYGLTAGELKSFHQERVQILAESGADLLAFETIPSLAETQALLDLLDESPGVWAWISFSVRDAEHLADGTPLAEAVGAVHEHRRIAAIGANCFAPSLAVPLAEQLAGLVDLPIVLYPNSGERYDARSKSWSGAGAGIGPAMLRQAGANCIGGCCRTTYGDIRRLRESLLP
ncbi:MAG: homocysteine S-methyltransferase [Rhodothermales bacterium]|nr:homocysteine S-methyltransferase [Rhodothermales bacterium]MBO6778657.1 homocysteine S-methyltransferase [Rhodothermales bacterium]